MLAAACSSVEPRTQVMLIVDADDAVRGMATSLQVKIEGSLQGSAAADGTTYTRSFDPHDPAGASWPFRFALTPRDGEYGRRYKITLSALDAQNDTLALLRSEGGFVKGKTLALMLRFEAGCLRDASLKCQASETCAGGNCVSASVDPSSLPGLSEIDGGPTGSISDPVAAAGSGGAGAAAVSGGAGAGGMSGTGSIKIGVSDCGDGALGAEEQCDTAIAAGQPGACPTECPKLGCQSMKLEGSGCQARCSATPISAPISDDGCCPPGADSSSDNDCMAQCGNGKIESGETCDPPGSCPSVETCIPANTCLMAVIGGAASSCNATCTMQPIAQCVRDDGCCPSGCTSANDNDCSASCGNGVVEAAARETCEPTSASQPCPTSCDDGDPCTYDLLTGSANNCNAVCTHLTISNPFSLDGCCPYGANANNDSDCPPMCGNGVVERGERCDGVCPEQADCDDHDSCTRDALNGRDCSRQCTHASIGPSAGATDGCCPAGANASTDGDCPPVCGNGVVERGERCDGNCPTQASCDDGKSCTADVITGSNCSRQCTHDDIGPNRTTPDGCCPSGANMDMDADCAPAPPMCGNGKRESGELCDGSDCPTAESCNDDNPCTRDSVTGAPCQLHCAHDAIAANAATKDGCCPANDESWQDADCDARCGNGHKEPGEMCDGADCPTAASCRDSDDCTEDDVQGSPCQLECSHKPIGAKPGDGLCCPAGSNKRQDSDCAAMCGNNAIEPGETCDPPNGTTCSATCQTIIPDPPPPLDGGI
jgi:hypothetical protein